MTATQVLAASTAGQLAAEKRRSLDALRLFKTMISSRFPQKSSAYAFYRFLRVIDMRTCLPTARKASTSRSRSDVRDLVVGHPSATPPRTPIMAAAFCGLLRHLCLAPSSLSCPAIWA